MLSTLEAIRDKHHRFLYGNCYIVASSENQCPEILYCSLAAAYDLYFGEEASLFERETVSEEEKHDIETIFEIFESMIIGLHLFEESKYTKRLVELYCDYQKRKLENDKSKLHKKAI